MRSKTLAGLFLQGSSLALVSSVLLAGCDPVLNVEGAFFPAWFMCVVAGVVAATVLRFAFLRAGLEEHLISAPLVYLCLAVALSLTIWLVFYRT